MSASSRGPWLHSKWTFVTPCAWMFRGLPLSLLCGPAGNCHSRSDRNMMNRCRPRSRVASQDSENREERCCQHGKSLSCERRSMLPGHSRLSRLHSIYNLICSSCHRVGQLRRSEGLIFDGLLQASKREAPLVDFGAVITPPRCQEVHRTARIPRIRPRAASRRQPCSQGVNSGRRCVRRLARSGHASPALVRYAWPRSGGRQAVYHAGPAFEGRWAW